MKTKICVFLCTYNGEKYLKRQLDSLMSQNDVEVSVISHDDGSSDRSIEILKEYNIPVLGSEHLGAAHGFFYLMEQAPEAQFYAFCDQDDIWDEDKLAIAVEALSRHDKPALYCCSTRLVNNKEQLLQVHTVDSHRSLSSRLFYSSISGNTIVFNKALRDIAVMHHPKEMVMHDSWMVKLCVAIGGELIIDETPHMDYRMHSNNVVGMELNLRQKFGKFKKIINSKGEGQELIDICSFYKDMVNEKYIQMAADTLALRDDASLRKEFIKKYEIDFKNRGFNLAFAIKVKKGNL